MTGDGDLAVHGTYLPLARTPTYCPPRKAANPRFSNLAFFAANVALASLDCPNAALARIPLLCPGEALPQDRLLGRIFGQLQRPLVGDARLVRPAEAAEQFGLGGVVEVVAVERICQVVELGEG